MRLRIGLFSGDFIISYLRAIKLIGLCFIIVILEGSCKKSALNPYCWGNLERATLVNRSICGPYVILESTGKRYVIRNDLPKSFKNDPRNTIPVLINYKLVEGRGNVVLPCMTEKEVKIRCIREQ